MNGGRAVARDDRPIFLVGFMGSGKTTVGKRVAVEPAGHEPIVGLPFDFQAALAGGPELGERGVQHRRRAMLVEEPHCVVD